MGRLKADKVLTTPAYPLIEAAHYLNLPLSTLRAWCLGQPLRADAKTRRLVQTDGVDLIVDRLGALINVTWEGQREMADVVRQHLKCIERNAAGVPARLFPFTRTDETSGQPAAAVIDPHVAFGRPVLAGRAVPTAGLADRFKVGDSFEQLGGDCGISAQAIEEVLRCELDRQAA